MSTSNRFLLVYGSQTGQAEAIAEEVACHCSSNHIRYSLHTLDEVDTRFKLEEYRIMVILTSSTGDGDPPDNACKFFRKMRDKDVNLEHLKYALLGLGDSNYTRFHNFPKTIDRLLQERGAKQFMASELADDAVGLEIVVEPWKEKLFAQLKTVVEEKGNEGTEKHEKHEIHENVYQKFDDKETLMELEFNDETSTRTITIERYSESDSNFPASNNKFIPVKMKNLRFLSNPSDETVARVHEITVHPPSEGHKEGFQFHAGDAFYIRCENDPSEVDSFLERLGVTSIADQACTLRRLSKPLPAHLPTEETSLRILLLRYVDIRGPPTRRLLNYLVEHCAEDLDRQWLKRVVSREAASELDRLIQHQISLLDLLLLCPSCLPPVGSLLATLGPLRPRLFSAASSPLRADATIRFGFSVVHFEAEQEPYSRRYTRNGVGTGHLERMALQKDPDFFWITPRPVNSFRLPADSSLPLIFIAAGSGITPIMGFLEHRQLEERNNDAKFGPMYLFYGVRSHNEYYFGEELEAFQREGVLKELFVAFSREENKCYVQKLMVQQKELVLEAFLDQNGIIYVCGDLKTMAKDVLNTVTDLVREHLGLSSEEATKKLKHMRDTGRYKLDTWG